MSSLFKSFLVLVSLSAFAQSYPGVNPDIKTVEIDLSARALSPDAQVTVYVGKEVTADCNGPILTVSLKSLSYDVIQRKHIIDASNVQLRSTLKYCPGDKPYNKVVFGLVSGRTFKATDKLQLKVPADMDVYLKVMRVVSFNRVD